MDLGGGGGGEYVMSLNVPLVAPHPSPAVRKVTLCTRYPPNPHPSIQPLLFSAGIFKQSMGARNRVGSGGEVR
jgi:hypothetical protein